MITERRNGWVKVSAFRRWPVWMVLVAVVLSAFGCGSDSLQTGSAAKYPTGISEDIEQQLKYDARVEGSDVDGQDLIVNVNDAWLHSPPGMRERALGHWYSMWQPAHPSSKIIVKYEGNEVERWTADKGFQPANTEKKPTEG